MRIAFLAPELWDSPWSGGKELTRALVEMGYQVTYIEPLGLRLEAGGKAHDASSPPLSMKVIRRPTSLGTRGIAYGICAEFRNLSALLRVDYDVLVTYYTVLAVLATLYTRLSGRRVLLVYADDLSKLFKPRLAGLVTRYFSTPIVARLSNSIVATAERLRRDMAGYNRRVFLIPNGVRLKSFEGRAGGKGNSAFVVGFVGAFGDWVDLDMLLEAAEALPEVKFLLVGAGEQFDYATRRASKLPNIELTGLVPFEEVPDYIQRMDVCLIPFKVNRLTDAVCPIKLFEYWAMGKPVIATAFHEMKRIAGDKVLFVGSGQELKEAIIRLREERRLGQELGRRGQQEVIEKYDWEVLAGQYRSVLSTL